jgi:hypothetical protein
VLASPATVLRPLLIKWPAGTPDTSHRDDKPWFSETQRSNGCEGQPIGYFELHVSVFPFTRAMRELLLNGFGATSRLPALPLLEPVSLTIGDEE